MRLPLLRAHASPCLAAIIVAILTATPATAQIPAIEYAQRRGALVAALDDGVVLALGSREPVPDFLPYHQASPFNYLTGFQEPGAALVIVKRGGNVREMLFVRANDPAQEVWTGPRVGVDGVRAAYGMEGRDAALLTAALDSLLNPGGKLHVIGQIGGRMTERTSNEQFIDELVAKNPAIEVSDARRAVDRLRGRKGPAELERLRIAAEISARGHLAAMRAIVPGIAEFEVEAVAEYTWRREGGDGPAYASIVGSGPNTTTLHYNRNTRVAADGELMLMDMATFFDGYAADITRTVPVNGRFTPAQRDIYAVVLAAQQAAERQIRVDGPARAMTDSATAVLRRGLARLGLIESADAMYDCGSAIRPRECPQLSLFYMHGLGHGIGLDVHDPDQYSTTGRIDVGSAFTIEPGVYVRGNILDIIPDSPRNRALKVRIAPAVARYADIGVRIEDDYLVTADGVIRASAGVPREIDEVEAVMALPRTPRDPAVVERYLRYKTGR
jgi:Xaa-Pro aminopeptidase